METTSLILILLFALGIVLLLLLVRAYNRVGDMTRMMNRKDNDAERLKADLDLKGKLIDEKLTENEKLRSDLQTIREEVQELRDLEAEHNTQQVELEHKVEQCQTNNEQLRNKLEEHEAFERGIMQVISDDVYEPLNDIIALSSATTEEKDYKRIYHISDLMSAQLQTIVDVWKFENRLVSLTTTNCLIQELVHEALEHVIAEAEEKDIFIEDKINADFRVLADVKVVRQILLLLLDNAVSATPQGGTIKLTSVSAFGFINVSITDSGAGIPSDKLSHVFDKFSAVEEQTARALGMNYCKLAVREHGGQVGAMSSEGEGATIWFTLPESR